MSLMDNSYAVTVGVLPLACKTSHFLPTIFFIVGRAGPPNTAGPRSIAVSATMVVTPLRHSITNYLTSDGVKSGV